MRIVAFIGSPVAEDEKEVSPVLSYGAEQVFPFLGGMN